MSKPKFNPDLPFEVPASKKPKFDPSAAYEEVSSDQEPKTSILEAAKTFGLEGASLGIDDELGGFLEAGGQAIGLKGLGAPTISETEFQTPNGLDLEKLMNAYRSARDRRRAIKEEQRKDRPGTALAANLVGGIATSPFLGGPVTQGALAGFGSSNADVTKGDIGGAILDTGLGAGLGYGIGKVIKAAPTGALVGAAGGGAIGAGNALLDENATAEDVVNQGLTGTLMGAGVGSLAGAAGKLVTKGAGKLLGKMSSGSALQQGFKEGLDGINIQSQQFGDDVTSKVNTLTKEVADPILEQKQMQVKLADDAKVLYENQKQNTIKNFENNIDELVKTQEEFKQASMVRQTAEKRESFDKLSDLTGKIANDFDTKFTKAEKDIGKDIEKVYETAGDAMQTPINLIDVVQNFVAELPKDKLTPKMQKSLDLANGEISLKDSKQLRDMFWSLRNDSDSNIRNAAREGYKNYNNKVQIDLDSVNPDLGATLKLNNGKYAAISRVRDNFIDYKDQVESGIHGVLRKFAKANMVPNTMEESFAKSQSKGELENLLNTLKTANPELADELQTQGTNLAQQQLTNKAIVPAAPTTGLPGEDKLSQLRAMMEQAKASKFQPPLVNEKFTQFGNDPLTVAQKFMNYLEKGQDKKEGLALKKEMDTFFQDLTSTKGEEFANTVKSQMQELSDKYKIYTPEIKMSDIFTTPGLGRTALKSSAVIGNKAGNFVKNINETPFIKGIKSVSDTVGKAYEKGSLIGNDLNKHISDATVGRLKASPDKVSQNLANMLENIKLMPKNKQNAAIFALSQNPVYRDKLNSQEQNRK